jgi:hypothetical protein
VPVPVDELPARATTSTLLQEVGAREAGDDQHGHDRMPDRAVERESSQSIEQVRPADMSYAAESHHHSTVRRRTAGGTRTRGRLDAALQQRGSEVNRQRSIVAIARDGP